MCEDRNIGIVSTTLRIILTVFVTFIPHLISAQIRIEVIRHPRFILSDSSLYITGTFNNWSPGDENFKLTRTNNDTYYFELPDTLDHFEYKFTQGGWAVVEGTADGRIAPNRVYDKNAEVNANRIYTVIEGWEKKPAYSFTINKIPENTPFEAAIYLMGNFNNWKPDDINYKLRKQIDGTYQTVLYFNGARLEYKFTRGNKKSVESTSGGHALPNRVAMRSNASGKVMVDIAGWEDISNGPQFYTIYDLLLLFSVFQGILLIITIPRIQESNREANRWLIILIGFTSAILLIKVVSSYPSVAYSWPKLQLIPDFILFIYAPLFYAYIQRLLFQSQNRLRSFFFIPVIVQFFIYMMYFLMDQQVFQEKLNSSDSEVAIIRFSMASAALAVNIYYWVLCLLSINFYKINHQNSNSYEQNLKYLNTVLFMQAACLIGWFITFAMIALGELFSWPMTDMVDISLQTIWMIFSLITFFLGYFFIHEPNLFRLPHSISQPVEPVKVELDNHVMDYLNRLSKEKEKESVENLNTLKEKLATYMEKYRPYSNPNLTLVELASRLKLQPHILSKVINSGFGMNFFDFVNTYRIDEFKKRVEDPHYKHYTLLGIAFDVGFNSKTAFNRSFKKITTQTPSGFFNTLK